MAARREKPGSHHRAGSPLTFAECVVIALRWRHGDPINDIAGDLRRKRTEVRCLIFGEAA